VESVINFQNETEAAYEEVCMQPTSLSDDGGAVRASLRSSRLIDASPPPLQTPSETAIANVELVCSFFQIYNEKVQDLLNADGGGDLQVRESAKVGVYVENLRELKCKTKEEVMDVLAFGESNRTVAATEMNAVSSRSHSVFCIKLNQKHPDKTTKSSSRLFMADLAGSERVSRSKVTGAGFEEATAINGSLSALGNCINALTEKGRSHIPFRDSKLTFILKDSLGGNAKTTLVVALSPHISNQEETVTTLKFAERCKRIKNTAKVNVVRSNKELEAIVSALTAEVEELRAMNELLEEALKAAGGKPPSKEQIAAKQNAMAASKGGGIITAPTLSGPESGKLAELEAEFEIQGAQLEQTQKALNAMRAEREAETAALREELDESKALMDVEKSSVTKLTQNVESLEHKLKQEISDREEALRELQEKTRRLENLEEDNGSLRTEMSVKEEEVAGSVAVLDGVSKQEEALEFDLHRALAEIKNLRAMLLEARGEEPEDPDTEVPQGLANTQMRLAEVMAEAEMKEVTVMKKDEEIDMLTEMTTKLSKDHRVQHAELRDAKADVDRWCAEADEALAKQAHMSVRTAEVSCRVDVLEKGLSDEAAQRSMFEMSWRTEIMDREIQDLELRRLQIDNAKLRSALEFEEKRNRWDLNKAASSIADAVSEAGANLRASEKEAVPAASVRPTTVTFFERQTYSTWAGEWNNVEEEAWLGQQLSQEAPHGHSWSGEWTVNTDNATGEKPSTDGEGWGYASAGGGLQERYIKSDTHGSKRLHHFARGRMWQRAMAN